MNNILKGYLLPGLPHILLAPDRNPGWKKIRQAYDQVQKEIEELNPDVLILYSTYWPSVIGHQVFAKPTSKWVHVDDQFHDLGSIPYEFKHDEQLGDSLVEKAKQRKLEARTCNYNGFPIDTGSVVSLKLLDPKSKRKSVILSSNVYSDRAETVVLGKATRDALEESGKTAVCIVISSLSNRLHTEEVDPKNDHIHSLKDQEWNQKFLEFLGEGRLEDVAQLSRQFHKEARVHKVSNFKPFWWLSSVMGQNNLYSGSIYAYEPIFGTGAAVVGLTPSIKAARDLEFDENDPDQYAGERNVLAPSEEVSDDVQGMKDTLTEAFGREP